MPFITRQECSNANPWFKVEEEKKRSHHKVNLSQGMIYVCPFSLSRAFPPRHITLSVSPEKALSRRASSGLHCPLPTRCVSLSNTPVKTSDENTDVFSKFRSCLIPTLSCLWLSVGFLTPPTRLTGAPLLSGQNYTPTRQKSPLI